MSTDEKLDMCVSSLKIIATWANCVRPIVWQDDVAMIHQRAIDTLTEIDRMKS